VFVAGLPALVFFTSFAAGVLLLVGAHTPSQAGIGVAICLAAGYGVAGTFGDLNLILLRLSKRNGEPPGG
jgi:hypothetical protein